MIEYQFGFNKAKFYLTVDPPMERGDLGLLHDVQLVQVSIQKWEAIVRFLEQGIPLQGDGASHTCPLCVIYMRFQCRGCPVIRLGGGSPNGVCRNTPYDEWVRVVRTIEYDEARALTAAQAELEFLRDLRILLLQEIEDADSA